MIRHLFLIASAVVVLLASCGNKGVQTELLVPKGASFVMHVNAASLSSKLSWEEIRQTAFFQEAIKHTSGDSMASALLGDPAVSGIDTKGDIVCFIKKRGRGSYFAVDGKLTDAAAYESLVKKMHKDVEVKTDGDFSIAGLQKSSVLVWNKSNFAIVTDMPTPDANPWQRNKVFGAQKFPTDSLEKFGKEILSLKSSDNLGTDKRFAELVKDGADMHMWVDISGLSGGMGAGVMSLMKMDILWKETVSAMSLNFENGKISLKGKTYHNDEMNKLLAKSKSKPVSESVINRIPSQDATFIIAFNFSPEWLKELIKTMGIDVMADAALARVNFSLDELISANEGEFLLSVEPPKTEMGDGMGPMKGAKVFFATAVGDKAAFEKLMALAGNLSKEGGPGAIPDMNYKLGDDWFAISNSAEYPEKFLAGSNNKLPFASKISGHPFGAYIDLRKLAQSAMKSDSSAAEIAGMWEDIVITGGDFDGDATIFQCEVNLTDKNTSSLKQINSFLDKMFMKYKEKGLMFDRDDWDSIHDAPKVEKIELEDSKL